MGKNKTGFIRPFVSAIGRYLDFTIVQYQTVVRIEDYYLRGLTVELQQRTVVRLRVVG
jgi:hypothetical protein